MATLVEVCDFGNFLELCGCIVAVTAVSAVSFVPVTADVVAGVPVPDLRVSACVVPEDVMSAGIMAVQGSMSAVVAAGIVSDVSGDHAENHVSEAQHGTNDIERSECS